jgi:hypothetical protein
VERFRGGGLPIVLKVLLCFLPALTAVYAQAPQDATASFDWDQRWQHYLQRTYSWQRMGLLVLDTTFDHVTGDSREWGRTPQGFGCRYGSNLGSRIVRNSIELGAGAALREDARFRPSGAKTLGGRVRYATLQAFVAYRGEERRFAYSRLAATVGGFVAVSLWGGRPISPWRFAGNVGGAYTGHLENSFLNEFGDDLKAVGLRVRKKVLGK